tara:strand:- start:76 stop:489 length:414 start_codon:yes stop_codon:yes gene_type:complete
MILTESKLRELIRQVVRELDFKSQDAFKAYQSKHKMRPSTKVNIGGKETTAGQASSEKEGPPLSKWSDDKKEHEETSFVSSLADEYAETEENEGESAAMDLIDNEIYDYMKKSGWDESDPEWEEEYDRLTDKVWDSM